MGYLLQIDPTLSWWRLPQGDRLLDGTVIKCGKTLRMVGERYDEEPQYFHVLHVPTPLRRLYRRRRGLDEEVRVDSFNAFRSPDNEQRYISDPLVLRQPGWRLRRGYRFADELGNRSRSVSVSEFGETKVGVSGGIPGGLNPEIAITFTGAIDPPVRFEWLTPWSDGPLELRALLSAEAEDEASLLGEDDVDHVGDELLSLLADFLPEEPPEGWQLNAPEEVFSVEEGQAVAAPMSLEAPTFGRAALAVQAVHAEDPGQASVSEVVLVEGGGDEPLRLLLASAGIVPLGR